MKRNRSTRLLMILAVLLLALGALALPPVFAQREQPAPPPANTMHPTFPLLDAAGDNVLASGAPVSTMETCGACHDTAFIAGHSFHADAGLSQVGAGGESAMPGTPAPAFLAAGTRSPTVLCRLTAAAGAWT
jgi:hypothetical protein